MHLPHIYLIIFIKKYAFHTQIVGYELSDWAMKSLNYLFPVSELRYFRYHVCTIKVLINKRVCDRVTYSTSIRIGNHAHTCARSHVDN